MFASTTSRALRRAAAASSSPSNTSPAHLCASCRRHLSSEPNPNDTKRVIFSGIQPTGIPHLGNYLGALKPWVKLQNEAHGRDRLLFSIVDLHAITMQQDPKQLMQWRREMFASFLAVGLDPCRSILFAQSDVPAHSEMMWILSCCASMGYLSRMTQWKTKMTLPETATPSESAPNVPNSGKKDAPTLKLGLFSYPVLQAADILLYRTTHVPVGEDQAQHLEFTRELAQSFNHAYRTNILTPPKTILSPAKRIMSLSEPTKKMSKSDPRPESRILITDSKEAIDRKIKKALTDPNMSVSYDPQLRPGVSNLIDIYYHLHESQYTSPEHVATELLGSDTSLKTLKGMVADAINKELEPVREKMNEVMSMSEVQISDLLHVSRKKARGIAEPQLKRMKQEMGLWWGFKTGLRKASPTGD